MISLSGSTGATRFLLPISFVLTLFLSSPWSSGEEYVSDSWGTKWGTDKEATAAKKAKLVAENPDKKPTSMRKQYMTYHEIPLTARDLSIHVPMGPIGGFVRSRGQPKDSTNPKSWHRVVSEKDYTCPDLTVVNLVKDAPGHKCGLEVGDIIYGASGKSFTPMDWDPNAGRKGPFRELGLAIEDSEANRQGLVELMVRRGAEEKIIKIQLPPGAGGFSKTYPFDCPKSAKYLESICDHLVSLQNEKNGSYGTGIMGSSVVGLALLASGDSKYKSSIARVTDYLNRKETMKAGCYAGWATTWQIMYQGVYLAEYFLVTGDEKVLPTIQHLVDVSCASMYNRMENKDGHYYGTFGHYINPDMDAQETVYKMTVITAGIAWSWSMASRAGADVPAANWEAITYHIKRATGRKGGAGYCGAGDGSGSHPSVANAMLALSCAPEDRRHDDNLAKRLKFLGNPDNFGSVMINHGVSVTPFYTSSLALYRTDKKAYRAFMDYWKWYIALTRGPDDHAIYWDMSGGGGDVKLGPDPFMNAAIAIMMAAPNQRLFTYNDGDKTKKGTGASVASTSGLTRTSSLPVLSGGRTRGKGLSIPKRTTNTAKKETKPASRKARTMSDKNAEALDKAILSTLVKLTDAKELKPTAIPMSMSKKKLTLTAAKSDGTLVFKTTAGKEASWKWDDLKLADEVNMALLMAKFRPESTDAQAIAGVYMERLGRVDDADRYYEKAGEASAAKLQKLFD